METQVLNLIFSLSIIIYSLKMYFSLPLFIASNFNNKKTDDSFIGLHLYGHC